jgi:hypothetical protein
LLLKNDRLQSDGGVAVPSSTIMEDDVNFFHWGEIVTQTSPSCESTLNAMWISE